MASGKRADKESLSSPTVFARHSTGLVKNVSFLDSIAINVSYMSVGAALALIGFTMVALPSVTGVNLIVGSAIAAALAIPQTIVYTIMQRKVSRTGGDYVWLSRSLGGFMGSTLTFMGITLETMPYLALIALSSVFAIGSVGVFMGFSGLSDLSVPGNAPVLQFLLGSVIVATFIGINIVRPRLGFRIISMFFIVGIVAVAVSTLTLLYAGRDGVAHYINSLQIPNMTFDSIANSYHGSSIDFRATLLVLPFFALFSYPWLNAAPSVGSELKGRKTVRWSAPVSLLTTFLILTIPFATMYLVGGFGFTNAALSNSTLVNDYSFNFWTLAMGVSTGNIALELLIGIGWIVLTLAVLAFGIITISRYLLAQAFDRFLPEKIAYVSPKFGSPVVAHLLDLAVTVALIGLASFLYGTISSLYGAVAASMIYFAFVGAGAVMYAMHHESARRTRNLLKVAGFLQVLVFSYLTYEFFAYPSVWGGNPLAYGYIIATFVVGIVIYAASKTSHARKGIDISMAFREIPPE
ncbi:MAG TPA: APC family permease [Nitrososphaerales archaeon]|nr:APC family permease [Nitrososphaerales archaeon]